MRAIAVFQGKKVKGTVVFTENKENDHVIIDLDLTGLKKNGIHGFHIHTYGDMSDGCESMCSHFNPFNKTHGGIDSKNRHLGDLGNIYANGNGDVCYSFIDNQIKLRGIKSNIIGRGLIIHEDPDDLGTGNNEASLITGNSGKRIACTVIGYARPL
jgi:Cu-Zn family superoxide dismutase